MTLNDSGLRLALLRPKVSPFLPFFDTYVFLSRGTPASATPSVTVPEVTRRQKYLFSFVVILILTTYRSDTTAPKYGI